MSLARLAAVDPHTLRIDSGASIETPEVNRQRQSHAGTTREEAIEFQPKSKGSPKSQVKLKREIATLVDVCILLGQSDCVLAHIRSLKRARKNLTVQMFEQAVRWAKPQLTKKAGDE